MDFDVMGMHKSFLEDIAELLDSAEAEAAEGWSDEGDTRTLRNEDWTFLRKLGHAGWLGVGFPPEAGGQGRTATEELMFLEELSYRRLPPLGSGIKFVGPAIARAGSEEQRARYLPGLLAGTVRFSVAYTEPDAGSDLAALRLRGQRVDDRFVLNGQKTFCSGVQNCTHLWLAARTDPAAERHEGISLFIVPIETAGIAVQPIHTATEIRVNEVFFQDVVIPEASLVGAENRGWQIMMSSMDRERLEPVSGMARLVDEASDWARQPDPDGYAPACSEHVLAALGRLYAEVDVARLFAAQLAWMIDEGKRCVVETSMAKIINTELRQTVSTIILDLLGEAGQLRLDEIGAPLGGRAERAYRGSTWMKIAGGANEIHRDLIATRGLGLPRPRVIVTQAQRSH
jgi:alkylation response protein AidB-like acyl-CoA dehydrogenase